MIEPRDIRHDILPEIRDRWSPRAFDPGRPVSDGDLLALLEAARQAPSCMNEQPWRSRLGSGAGGSALREVVQCPKVLVVMFVTPSMPVTSST